MGGGGAHGCIQYRSVGEGIWQKGRRSENCVIGGSSLVTVHGANSMGRILVLMVNRGCGRGIEKAKTKNKKTGIRRRKRGKTTASQLRTRPRARARGGASCCRSRASRRLSAAGPSGGRPLPPSRCHSPSVFLTGRGPGRTGWSAIDQSSPRLMRDYKRSIPHLTADQKTWSVSSADWTGLDSRPYVCT
jgi:hypothetical protein